MRHLRAQWRRIASVEDYGGGHQPTEGPPAHDLLAEVDGGSFAPDDVYDHPDYYTGFSAEVRNEVMPQLRKARGNPEAMVTIYRSLPAGITTIERGNWISLSKDYCRQHGMSNGDPSEDWPVIAAQVPAKHVLWAGDDLVEWGYFGPTVQARVV